MLGYSKREKYIYLRFKNRKIKNKKIDIIWFAQVPSKINMTHGEQGEHVLHGSGLIRVNRLPRTRAKSKPEKG
jgi:hypothetical protein